MSERSNPFTAWSDAEDAMDVDFADREDEFVATVALPGFDPADVDVSVTSRALSVEAAREDRSRERGPDMDGETTATEALRRSVHLPGDVDVNGVTATMRDGVLTIRFPKLDAHAARTIEIERE